MSLRAEDDNSNDSKESTGTPKQMAMIQTVNRKSESDGGHGLPFIAFFAGDVSSIAFSPKGQRLVTGGGDRDQSVRVWDISKRQELCKYYGHLAPKKKGFSGEENSCVFFLGDENTVVSLSKTMSWGRTPDGGNAIFNRGSLFLWNILQTAHSKRIQSFLVEGAPSPDGQSVAALSLPDGMIEVFRPLAHEDTKPTILKGLTDVVFYDIKYSPNGKYVAAACYKTPTDKRAECIACWEASTGKMLGYVNIGDDRRHYEFMPNGNQIAFLKDGKLQTVNLQNLQAPPVTLISIPNREYTNFSSGFSSGFESARLFALSPDGEHMVLASDTRIEHTDGRFLVVIPLKSAAVTYELHFSSKSFASCIGFSRDSQMLAVGTRAGSDEDDMERQGAVYVWSASSWSKAATQSKPN